MDLIGGTPESRRSYDRVSASVPSLSLSFVFTHVGDVQNFEP